MEQAKKSRLPTEQEARLLAEYLRVSGDFEYRKFAFSKEPSPVPSFFLENPSSEEAEFNQGTFSELRCLDRFGEVRQTTIRFFEDSLEVWEEDQRRNNRLVLKLPYDKKYTSLIHFAQLRLAP